VFAPFIYESSALNRTESYGFPVEMCEKKAEPFLALPFPLDKRILVYLLNFFLNPRRPTTPDPRRSRVAGSGTGVTT